MKKLLSIIALLCISVTTFAQDYSREEEEDKEETTNDIPPAIENIRLFYSLYFYGYKNQDALSLLMAARILKQNNYPLPDIKVEKILAAAKQCAKGDTNLLALIKKAERTVDTSANNRVYDYGAVGKEKYSLDMISAYTTDTYKIAFKENKKATVKVTGVGLTDLDLYIYDNNGNLIISDTKNSDDCECSWIPKWTGEFTIRIKNQGGIYNLYYMQTN